MQRLRAASDFEHVFRQGRAVAGRLLVVRMVRRTGGGSRVGIAVGRRLGGAVQRNRVRRRWREVVRLGPELRGHWDVVLIARAACRDADWEFLVRAWRDVLVRAGLLVGGGG